MELPFYCDVVEFEKNFKKNFLKWSETNNNNLADFKVEYQKLYEMFSDGYSYKGSHYFKTIGTDYDVFSYSVKVNLAEILEEHITNTISQPNNEQLIDFLDNGVCKILPYGINGVILDSKFYRLLRHLLAIEDNKIVFDKKKIMIIEHSLPLILELLKLNSNFGEQKTPPIEDLKNMDFSDTKINEKIIMLEKLGVLDFLKNKEPFNVSTNALASVLSGVTGEKQETIQSYINPIINKTAGQKNNPLKNSKTVNKVVQKLLAIGYNTSN